MTQDTLTALLLNPFLTFDEAEREHRALCRNEPKEEVTARPVRRPANGGTSVWFARRASGGNRAHLARAAGEHE